MLHYAYLVHNERLMGLEVKVVLLRAPIDSMIYFIFDIVYGYLPLFVFGSFSGLVSVGCCLAHSQGAKMRR